MTRALIIIDVINEMLHPNGKLAPKGYVDFLNQHNSIKALNQAIAQARQNNDLVIFARIGFSSDYHDCPKGSPLFMNAPKFGALMKDTWATEFLDGIDIQDTDIFLDKTRVSAFYQTGLHEILQEKSVTHLSFVGCATDLAVNSAVREAHDRDYIVTVLSDCCIAANDNDHISTLELLKKVATVV